MNSSSCLAPALSAYSNKASPHSAFQPLVQHWSSKSRTFRSQIAFLTSSSQSQLTDAKPSKITWFQHYKNLLKAHPGSHLSAFLILHEITAILPIPLVFYALQSSNVAWGTVLPESWLEGGDKRVRKTMKALGLPEIEEGGKAALNAAATYGIVKALMPARWASQV